MKQYQGTSSFTPRFINKEEREIVCVKGLNCVLSQKIQVEVLTPSTSECDCIWRLGLYRGSLVKIRSLVWSLIQYDQRTSRSRRGNLDIQRDTRHVCIQRDDHKDMVRRKPSTSQGESLEQIFPYSPQKELILLIQ